MRKNMQNVQQLANFLQKHNKFVQKCANLCKPKYLAQRETISTDGVTRVNRFLHLCILISLHEGFNFHKHTFKELFAVRECKHDSASHP